MLLAFLLADRLADRLADGAAGTPAVAGILPTSRALAAEHKLARRTFDAAADRLVGQGHLTRSRRDSRVIDPLVAEWLRRR